MCCFVSVVVTCEHVRHNKSSIAHLGNNQVQAQTTPTPLVNGRQDTLLRRAVMTRYKDVKQRAKSLG